jgi:hypothetical protein
MNVSQTTKALRSEPVPVIGECPKCGTQIFASHPYAWCVKCGETLPYRLNMARRPVMYENCAVWPFDFKTAESKDH